MKILKLIGNIDKNSQLPYYLFIISKTLLINSIVAKAANIVKDICPDTCPCCNSGNQKFEHWLLECPIFNYHRSKYLCLTDTSLNNINNLNTNVNLLNDNSNYKRNSNVENRLENNINNSSTNNIIDHDNSRNLGNNGRNLGNSNRINSDNYVDNEINNECNNTRELVNVTNSDSNENGNRNLDFSNNFISIMTRGSNSNSGESSSNWRGYIISFLVERKNLIQ